MLRERKIDQFIFEDIFPGGKSTSLCWAYFRVVAYLGKDNFFGWEKSFSKVFEGFFSFEEACVRLEENFNVFQEQLLDWGRKELKENDLKAKLDIEKEIELKDINFQFLEQIKRFAPFGHSNPEPLFLTKGVLIKDGDAPSKRIISISFLRKRILNPIIIRIIRVENIIKNILQNGGSSI